MHDAGDKSSSAKTAIQIAITGCSVTSSEGRIALFSAYYPSHGGGMELACLSLAQGFLAAGLRVEWTAQQGTTTDVGLGVNCNAVAGTDIIYRLCGVPVPVPAPWALSKIWQAAKRADVVVIAEANFILSVLAFLVAGLLKKPVALVQHVGEPSTLSKVARLIMRIGEVLAVRPMIRRADVVICVSPVVAQYFRGEQSKRDFITIGPGVDTEHFRPPNNIDERATDRASLGLNGSGKLACFVGRLTESKGILVIAEMAKLRPDWTFAVAGTGPVDPAQWGLSNVVALGHLDHDGVARLYRASDLMVLPSQSESYSLVVREAIASGCGVLCSDQILQTDPQLAPFIVHAAVDLLNPYATSEKFAAALDRQAAGSPMEARDYVVRSCSRGGSTAEYLRQVEALLSQRRVRS